MRAPRFARINMFGATLSGALVLLFCLVLLWHEPLATFVALIAALNGWIICWGASDWFGALAAFAWLPWAWWGLERAVGASAVASPAYRYSSEDHRPGAFPTSVRWRFLWPAPFV